jgi:plasmid stability protein
VSQAKPPRTDIRQVSMYLDAELTNELRLRAVRDGKPQKAVVTEALRAHLRGAGPRPRR